MFEASNPIMIPERSDHVFAAEVIAAGQALQSGQTLSLDASQVSALDSSTVLAIANVAQSAQQIGATAAVLSPSDAFVDSFTELGLFEPMMKLEFRS
ncbi:MAG: STAS domain-containing protein [Neomegalonema sp.]|nr:STAS domain-containing protein [Neomegalonema sp.]